MVLTDEEKDGLLKAWESGTLQDLIEDVEAALLEKLKQQEPVAWSCDGGGEEADEDWATHDHSKVRRHIKSGGKCIKLYADPVPAAVPEALTQEPLRGDEPIGPQAARADYVRGWNACRNAMLSAAAGPVREREARVTTAQDA